VLVFEDETNFMLKDKSTAGSSLLAGTHTAVTVGTFDGVHRGHLGILKELLDVARQRNLKSMVVTFDPHPRRILQHNHGMKLLSSPEAKVRLMAELGIDYVVVLKFDLALSQLSPERFVQDYLISRYGMRALVIGYDHALGKERTGREKVLNELSSVFNYSLIQVPPVILDGKPVSSSWVRAAIEQGDMGQAAKLLGRYYSFTGRVIPGAGRGKRLGHPTANLELVFEDKQLFPEGIYAATVDLDGRLMPGALHHGPRPTFDELAPTLELNLFDFSGDLYERTLEVSIIERIRPIMRFKSAGELVKQMDRDDREVKRVFEKIKIPAFTLSRAV
jgi:riboflavin kinase/FMN adenylyltransferase